MFSAGLLFVSAFLTASSYADDASLRRPKLVINDEVFAFGEVPEGSIVKHDFTIENKGSSDLTISRVIPSCGCTNSRVGSEVVPPGESTILHVEFNTGGFSGDKTKTVRIVTNDPDQSASIVTLKGHINDDVLVEPTRLSFEQIRRTEIPAMKGLPIVLKVQSDSKTIGKIVGASKYLLVTDEGGDSHSRNINVRLSPNTPVGEFRDRVIITYRGHRESSIVVPVYAVVTGGASITPASLSFGVLSSLSPFERRVRLECDSSCEVREIVSSSPAVRATLSEISKGSVFSLNVVLDPKLVPINEDLRSNIKIVTSLGTVVLPVYGMLPPANGPG